MLRLSSYVIFSSIIPFVFTAGFFSHKIYLSLFDASLEADGTHFIISAIKPVKEIQNNLCNKNIAIMNSGNYQNTDKGIPKKQAVPPHLTGDSERIMERFDIVKNKMKPLPSSCQ